MVGLEHFTMRPSRFECLYATDTLEELLEWEKLFKSYNISVIQVVKLETIVPIFKGNASLLPTLENSSF